MASMDEEGPRAGQAQQRRDHKGREMGLTCGAACCGRTVVSLYPYEVVIRFVVAGGSIVLMLQALDTRHHAFAALFGALALLYNPVAPLFSFSGDWQRLVVLASAVPFLASLPSLNSKDGTI